MSKLSAYIDNMFIGLPETDEVLDAKRIIKENMTEKYEDLIAQGKNEAEAFGTVAGEFGSMEELCKEMGWDFTRGSESSFNAHVNAGAQNFKDAAKEAAEKTSQAAEETVEEVKSWGSKWNTRENRRILATLIVRYIAAAIIIAVLAYLLRDSAASFLLIGIAVLFVSFYPKSPLYVYKERVAKEHEHEAQEAAAKAEAQAVAAALAAVNNSANNEKEKLETKEVKEAQ